ncbi:MAG: TetR-like C-terminal domain-containing protein, partial [Bacilli bacterium]
QDQRFIQAMISENGDPFFLSRIQDIMIEYTLRLYKNSFKNYDENYARVIMTFIVAGGVGVFTEWFKNGCSTPINEVIAPCEAIISKGMNNL